MADLGCRARANIDVVLELVCRQLPNGGDHESRKFIAKRMVEAAEAGHFTLTDLTAVARRAMIDLKNRPKSA